MFAVRPICAEDAIFKMSGVSPDFIEYPNQLHCKSILMIDLYFAETWNIPEE